MAVVENAQQKANEMKSLRNSCERFLKSHKLPEIVELSNGSKHYSIEYRRIVVNISHFLGIRGTATLVSCSAASISRWRNRLHNKIRTDHTSCITPIMVEAIKTFVEDVGVRAHDVQHFIKERFHVDVSRQLVQIILSKKLNLSFKRTRKRGRSKEYNPEYESRARHFIDTALIRGQPRPPHLFRGFNAAAAG